MPRASKIKTKKEDDSVFQMIVGVTVVALLAGINLFFFESAPASAPAATADISSSVPDSVLKASEIILPEEQAKLADFDPSDPMPQCDFRTDVRNVIYGQPVTFLWDCVGADECSLDSVGSVPVVKPSGVEIMPKRSAKYQLVCSNKKGSRSFDTEVGVFEFSLREVDVTKQ